MIRARISGKKDLEKAAADLFHVLVNLRHWEKKWKDDGGGMSGERMRAWQKRADDLIQDLTTDNPSKDYDAAAELLHEKGYNLARVIENEETQELNISCSPILMSGKVETIKEMLGDEFWVSGNTNLQYIIVKKR
jgi:hypothetical protein